MWYKLALCSTAKQYMLYLDIMCSSNVGRETFLRSSHTLTKSLYGDFLAYKKKITVITLMRESIHVTELVGGHVLTTILLFTCSV